MRAFLEKRTACLDISRPKFEWISLEVPRAGFGALARNRATKGVRRVRCQNSKTFHMAPFGETFHRRWVHRRLLAGGINEKKHKSERRISPWLFNPPNRSIPVVFEK
jgi:hypothetical protein